MVVKLIVSSAARILAAGGLLRREQPDDEREVHRANCPRCDQRVRYSPERAGRHVTCPRCRRGWTLPGAPARRRSA